MLPLWKLNPAADGEINLQDDLPRDKYHVYRNAEQKPIFIRAQYSLNGDEQAELAKIIRCDPTVLSAVIVERDFDGNYSYIFPNEPEHKNEEDSFVDIDGVTEYIASHMPKYVYYSNYGNLDSQIYLPAVLQNMNRTDLGIKEAAKARTLSTLFKYVNLDPKEITDMGAESSGTPNATQIEATANKKKEREILLSSAAAGFTKSFNEWWKQGNYIFEFKADGNYFRIWVSDSIRPEPIELEARSTGLQWFFSFYLVFLVESELHHRNAILLLDEPGVTLHPLAQKDLFTFFENLSLNNQIIYTTHSPFMVDSNHLERVRSVYIDTLGKTTVSADLRAAERFKGKNQPQSIYPAHAALGLSVSDTLLINCNPVLVEGESDPSYISPSSTSLRSMKVSCSMRANNRVSVMVSPVFASYVVCSFFAISTGKVYPSNTASKYSSSLPGLGSFSTMRCMACPSLQSASNSSNAMALSGIHSSSTFRTLALPEGKHTVSLHTS